MSSQPTEAQLKAIKQRAEAPFANYRLKPGYHWGKEKEWGHGSKHPNGPIVRLQQRDVDAVPHQFETDAKKIVAFNVNTAEAELQQAQKNLKLAEQQATEEQKTTKKTGGKGR